MIKISKPVQLLEWGEGTNTNNQNWSLMAKGSISSKPKRKEGVTTIIVEVSGQLEKKNAKDDSVKVMQQGEGMTPFTDKWGEVAMGRLRSIEKSGGKTLVYIDVQAATKVGR